MLGGGGAHLRAQQRLLTAQLAPHCPDVLRSQEPARVAQHAAMRSCGEYLSLPALRFFDWRGRKEAWMWICAIEQEGAQFLPSQDSGAVTQSSDVLQRVFRSPFRATQTAIYL